LLTRNEVELKVKEKEEPADRDLDRPMTPFAVSVFIIVAGRRR
jgi:hypothetical protein